jgi:hypothetical protein
MPSRPRVRSGRRRRASRWIMVGPFTSAGAIVALTVMPPQAGSQPRRRGWPFGLPTAYNLDLHGQNYNYRRQG